MATIESAVYATPSLPQEYFANFASAYTEEVDELLRRIHAVAIERIPDCVDAFYASLWAFTGASSIRARLSQEEFDKLRARQAQHLIFLFSSGTTPQEHYQRALHVGWVHELIGLDLSVLLEAYHLYGQAITHCILSADFEGDQREQLAEALLQRLHLESEAQIASHSRFDIQIASFLTDFDKTIQQANNYADLLRNSLQVIGNFDGISACLLIRPDSRGAMQVEHEGGLKGQLYADAILSRRARQQSTRTNAETRRGPSALAWRRGRIQLNDSFSQNEAMRPWRAQAEALGLRASAAIPLLDESDQAFAVLNLYSDWPGFFSAVTRQGMLLHIQQVLSFAVLRCQQSSTMIPIHLRQQYRQLLEDGAVRMLYQPIINFHTGKLDSVEALARLRTPEGEIIAPAEFLPAFGNAALLALFRAGLEQVCRDTQAWREQDPDLNLPVALNLPPEGLTNDAYRDAIFETLSHSEFPAGLLKLEMLETREPPNQETRAARIAELQHAGIRIMQDDLGSGYSSLLRMDRVPFNGVKIDQALVRRAVNNPYRALEFIYHLVMLANDVGIPVTVEGLEDDAMIEAAAILGADFGQGYGIARPMPPENLMAWNQNWSLHADRGQPCTALGALAGYLLWDRKLGLLAEWPGLVRKFIEQPCLVWRYLDREETSDPELATLLERNHFVALLGGRNQEYARTRQQIIDRLSEAWLQTRRNG
jgi:EAL domain-containing protein (putative c-di-GMP-specific phosphodiesterase class I)